MSVIFTQQRTRGPPGPLVFYFALRALRDRRRWIGRHRRAARTATARRRRARREILGRTRLLAGHDVVDLLGVDGFPFQQGLGHRVHPVLVVLDQLARQRVLLVDDAAHLGVDLLHG